MSQTITPELRQWIVDQARAGHSADAVLQSMKSSGWNEDVAIEAMESTLRGHLDQQAQAQGLPPAVPVPEPDVADSPLYLDGGDRQVAVLGSLALPRVVILGGLLSDQECDALIAAARPRLSRSLTVATQTGGSEVNPDRTSQGMFFQRGESELVARIEARIARLIRWPVENGEGIQVLHGTATIVKRGGQRVGTVVMYLSEPEKGGGTSFPDVFFEVAPKRGNAVFFSYERPHPSTKTLHGGSPVIEGEKWIATKWLREREFR